MYVRVVDIAVLLVIINIVKYMEVSVWAGVVLPFICVVYIAASEKLYHEKNNNWKDYGILFFSISFAVASYYYFKFYQ